MSFFSDLFKGNFSSLGTDIEHAPTSLAKHPAELAETLGGALALGTGGLGLAGGLGAVGDLFGGAGTAISDAAGSVGSGISNAASSVGNYFGLGGGSDVAAGASSAADLSPTAGDTPSPIVSPATANATDLAESQASGIASGAAPASATPAAGDTSTLGSIGNYLKSNAGVLGLGAAGLGANLAAPMLAKLGLAGSIPNQGTLTNIAGQAGSAAGNANAYASTLEAPLTTGVLPAGAQAQVTQALNDSITAIKARYANLGLSGSTMEQSAISEAQSQSQQMAFTIAQQMAQTGLQAGSQAAADLGLEGTIYQNLTQDQISQDTALQNAIASFTGAVGGGIGRGLVTQGVKTATG